MAANVETMFYVREKPWHGLGTNVEEAPASKEALIAAGLNWNVRSEDIHLRNGKIVEGYKANVRDTDRAVLGVVTDHYRVVQNWEAFAFTDALLGEGVRYETAGSLLGGRKVWMLARMPHEYVIGGERISPYLLFSNAHDGSGPVRVAITPIRVVCNNTLNLALRTARRSWSLMHKGKIQERLEEARNTLFLGEQYMNALEEEFDVLRKKELTDRQVQEYIQLLLPVEPEVSERQRNNILWLRSDLERRYFDAPDLQETGRNAYRFINAVSDFATHAEPLRKTAKFKENLFARTIEGNPLIDKAYQMMRVA